MPLTLISGPTIANGASLSSVLDASNANAGVTRITMPAQWTSSAWLTFQISTDGVTFTDLYWPNGALVVVTVVPGGTVATNKEMWQAGYFKFRSGSPANPIVQLATRTFQTVTS